MSKMSEGCSNTQVAKFYLCIFRCMLNFWLSCIWNRTFSYAIVWNAVIIINVLIEVELIHSLWKSLSSLYKKYTMFGFLYWKCMQIECNFSWMYLQSYSQCKNIQTILTWGFCLTSTNSIVIIGLYFVQIPY